MSPSTPDSLKGRRIDRYELQELIGEGGMGAVYRAVDTRLGRTVALKTVIAHRVSGALAAELRQRFMREALAASKVEHRNVVQVIDFGVTDDDTPYLVMEFLRGHDLGDLLQKTRAPMAIEQVADIMLAVCAALRACHQSGIVHRDLKPSNIFLAETDTGPEIKVLDFGVSKAPIAGELTQEGQILGTPQYMSPEQVNGRVGPESDQYALGVLLYVCLTRKLPFEEHQNLSLLRAIDVGRFPPPRTHRLDIPPKLEAIILRAMHTNPAERFASVHALGQALWSFASNRGKLEWRNFYFPTPGAETDHETFPGGITPGQPAGDDPRAVLQKRPGVEPTAILPTSAAELPPPPTPPPAPERYVSTKLAKPPSQRNVPSDIFAAESVGNGSPSTLRGRGRRGLPVVAVAAAVLVGGGGFSYWRLHHDAPAAIVAPTVSLTPAPSHEPPATAAPPPEAPAPEPARPPAALPPPAAVPPPLAAQAERRTTEHSTSSRVERKKGGTKKKHPTSPAESPTMNGLDQNGIGIPSN